MDLHVSEAPARRDPKSPERPKKKRHFSEIEIDGRFDGVPHASTPKRRKLFSSDRIETKASQVKREELWDSLHSSIDLGEQEVKNEVFSDYSPVGSLKGHKKKKKKHKDETCMSTDFSMDDAFNSSDSHIERGSVKSEDKRSVRGYEQSEEEVQLEKMMNQLLDSVDKRKKKKKLANNTGSDLSTSNASQISIPCSGQPSSVNEVPEVQKQEEDLVQSFTSLLSSPKKKKKKKKFGEDSISESCIDESVNRPEESVNQQITMGSENNIDGSMSKKKKKKKTFGDDTVTESCTDCFSKDEAVNRPEESVNQKRITKGSEDNIDAETNGSMSKKKKKKKFRDDSLSESPKDETVNRSEESLNQKRITKESEDNIDAGIDGSMSQKKKKKKKKKIRDDSLSESCTDCFSKEEIVNRLEESVNQKTKECKDNVDAEMDGSMSQKKKKKKKKFQDDSVSGSYIDCFSKDEAVNEKKITKGTEDNIDAEIDGATSQKKKKKKKKFRDDSLSESAKDETVNRPEEFANQKKISKESEENIDAEIDGSLSQKKKKKKKVDSDAEHCMSTDYSNEVKTKRKEGDNLGNIKNKEEPGSEDSTDVVSQVPKKKKKKKRNHSGSGRSDLSNDEAHESPNTIMDTQEDYPRKKKKKLEEDKDKPHKKIKENRKSVSDTRLAEINKEKVLDIHFMPKKTHGNNDSDATDTDVSSQKTPISRMKRHFEATDSPDTTSRSLDDLLHEIKENDPIPEEVNQQLANLHVVISWDVPPLHQIETRITNRPTTLQREQIDALGVPVKSGTLFSSQEDRQIKKNWKRFCKLHDLPRDPTPFLSFQRQKGKIPLPTEERVKFARSLAHELPDRLLCSVYKRFRKLFTKGRLKTGRFTKKEDETIVEYIRSSQSKTPYSDLGKILNRDKLSIERRCSLLVQQVEGREPAGRWTARKIEEFTKHFVEVLKVGKVEELADRHVGIEEWKEMQRRMGIPWVSLKQTWMCTIYPKFFVSKDTTIVMAKKRLISLLLERGETDWRCVDWNSVAEDMGKDFKGFTGLKLMKLLKHVVSYHVDANKRHKLGECLQYLDTIKDSKLKGKKIKKLKIVDNR